MTGDPVQPDVTDRDGSPEPPDALDATIEDVFDRLMALDGAMGTLADAEVGMVQALEHAEAVADAYRDRSEHAEAVRQLDELRDVAYRTLAALVGAMPIAVEVDEGPPARGSSPQLVAPRRARRATVADSPHALRDASDHAGDAAPATAPAGSSAMATTSERPLPSNLTPAPTGDARLAPEAVPASAPVPPVSMVLATEERVISAWDGDTQEMAFDD